MCHTMQSGYPWRLFHFEEKVKSVVKSVFAVRCYPCIVCHTEHALNELHECGTCEEGGEL